MSSLDGLDFVLKNETRNAVIDKDRYLVSYGYFYFEDTESLMDDGIIAIGDVLSLTVSVTDDSLMPVSARIASDTATVKRYGSDDDDLRFELELDRYGTFLFRDDTAGVARNFALFDSSGECVYSRRVEWYQQDWITSGAYLKAGTYTCALWRDLVWTGSFSTLGELESFLGEDGCITAQVFIEDAQTSSISLGEAPDISTPDTADRLTTRSRRSILRTTEDGTSCIPAGSSSAVSFLFSVPTARDSLVRYGGSGKREHRSMTPSGNSSGSVTVSCLTYIRRHGRSRKTTDPSSGFLPMIFRKTGKLSTTAPKHICSAIRSW